jgi:hypothetical protein
MHYYLPGQQMAIGWSRLNDGYLVWTRVRLLSFRLWRCCSRIRFCRLTLFRCLLVLFCRLLCRCTLCGLALMTPRRSRSLCCFGLSAIITLSTLSLALYAIFARRSMSCQDHKRPFLYLGKIILCQLPMIY